MPTPYRFYHHPYHNIHTYLAHGRVGKHDLAGGGRGRPRQYHGGSAASTPEPPLVLVNQCVSDREMDAILDEEFNAQHSKNRNDPLPVSLSAEEKKLTSASFQGSPSSLALVPQAAPVAAACGQNDNESGIYSNITTTSPINAYPEFPTSSDATSDNSKKENSKRKLVVAKTSTSVDSKARDQDTFNEKLEMLKAFKKSHGHTNVTGKYLSLYLWCLDVRRGYMQWKAGERNRHGINYAQVTQLEDIGFKWETKRPLVTHDSFEVNIKKLKEFREKHGHVNVPRNHSLKIWCYRIRKRYKLWVNGVINAKGLTDERVKRLEELGFEWDPKGKMKKEYMESKFQELLEFKQKHGHLNVPNSSKRNTRYLYLWCNRVRLEYMDSIANKVSLPGPFGLTEEYVHRLREIGFCFDISEKKSFEERLEDQR